jgi:hypothetical protein
MSFGFSVSLGIVFLAYIVAALEYNKESKRRIEELREINRMLETMK